MTTYLTKAGVLKLQEEMKQLQKQKLELTDEVRKAREHGDLRENAEYHAAKERLTQVVEKLTDLQYKMADVTVVDPSQQKSGTAVLGMRVKVKDLSTNRTDEYTLVGPDETDPSAGKISVLAPLGRAFLGHKAGEKVTAVLPAGPRSFEIISIKVAD